MNISVNLLPDIRQARLRQQHLRRLVTSLSILVCIVSAGIIIILLLMVGAQKLQLQGLDSDISKRTSDVKAIPNLNEALTAQSAIAALPSLYNKRTYYSLFLSTIGRIAPVDVSLNALTTGIDGGMTVSGTAASVASVDKLYESMRASGGVSDPTFSNLVITSIAKDQTGKASFTMSATVSPSATAAATTASDLTGGTK